MTLNVYSHLVPEDENKAINIINNLNINNLTPRNIQEVNCFRYNKTLELQGNNYTLEQMTGIEPASQPWQGRILTVVLHLQVVTSMGFEPMNAAVKGQCVKPLHQLAKRMAPQVGLEPTTP